MDSPIFQHVTTNCPENSHWTYQVCVLYCRSYCVEVCRTMMWIPTICILVRNTWRLTIAPVSRKCPPAVCNLLMGWSSYLRQVKSDNGRLTIRAKTASASAVFCVLLSLSLWRCRRINLSLAAIRFRYLTCRGMSTILQHRNADRALTSASQQSIVLGLTCQLHRYAVESYSFHKGSMMSRGNALSAVHAIDSVWRQPSRDLLIVHGRTNRCFVA